MSVSSILTHRSTGWKIDVRLASLMDSIFAIGFGLGLRFVVDAVSDHDFKITGTLVGLWEGVIMLHFTKKMPKSSDPFIAYAVRLFVDFLCTDSVTRLVLVLVWTALGMVLADVTPAIWYEVGLRRVWRRFRRDIYTMSQMIPTVAFFPPTRTVRFSPSREPSIITDADADADAVPPPSVITTEQTPTTNTVPTTTAPAAREILRRRVPGYFPADFSDTETELGSVRLGPSPGERTSRRLSVYPGIHDFEESVSSQNDLDEENLSSTSSTSMERPGASSTVIDASTIPDMYVEEEALVDVVAAPVKDEEEMKTPKQSAAPYMPPTPSDSAMHIFRRQPSEDPLLVRPPSEFMPQIPDFLDEANTEDWEKIQRQEATEEKPPTPPAKDPMFKLKAPIIPAPVPPQPQLQRPSTPSPEDVTKGWDMLESQFISKPNENNHATSNVRTYDIDDDDDMYGDLAPEYTTFPTMGESSATEPPPVHTADFTSGILGPDPARTNPWAGAEGNRMDDEVERRQREDEEAARKQEEDALKKKQEEEDAAEARRLEEERLKEKKAQEKAERLRKEAEDDAIRKKKREEEEEAAERKRKEEAAAAERKRKEAEEAEERKRKDEERERKEEEQKRKEDEKRRKKEEAEQKKEEEKQRKKEEAEQKKREEAERKKREEEEKAAARAKKLAEEAEAKRLKEEEAAEKKRLEEEAAAIAAAAAAAVAQALAEEEERKKEEEATAKRLKEESEAARVKAAEEARLILEEERRTKEQEEADQRQEAEERGRTEATQAEPLPPSETRPPNDAEQDTEKDLPLQPLETQADAESAVSEASEAPPNESSDRLDRMLLLRAQMVQMKGRLSDLRSPESDQEIKQTEKILRKMRRQAERRYAAGTSLAQFMDNFDDEDTVLLDGFQPQTAEQKIEEKLEALLFPDANTLFVKIIIAKRGNEAKKQKPNVVMLLDRYNLTSYTSESAENKKIAIVNIPEEKFADWLTGYRILSTRKKELEEDPDDFSAWRS